LNRKNSKRWKKAKKYDFLLASFLVKIIVDKKYDSVLESLFKSMDHWYTSNFVLGIISLINTEISNKIRELSNKEQISFNYTPWTQIEFDDNELLPEIKNRINFWIEDIVDSVTIEYSNIQTERVIEIINNDNEIISNYVSKVFIFFLKDINITISETKALNISDFIISEVSKALNNLKIKEI